MLVVNIKLDGHTVLAQTYKTKAAAKKRYEKAVIAYNKQGWTVELQTAKEGISIFDIYEGGN